MAKIRIIIKKGSKVLRERYIDSTSRLSLINSPSFVVEETKDDVHRLEFSYSGSTEVATWVSVPDVGDVSVGRYTGRISCANIRKGVDTGKIQTDVCTMIKSSKPNLSASEMQNIEEGAVLLSEIIKR